MADDLKPEATPKVETAQKPTRLTRAKEYRVAYANTFRFRITNTDVSVTFGYQSELPTSDFGGTQQYIQDEVEVVLTPFTLKLLKIAVDDNLDAYEKQAGTITLPPELLESLAAAKARVMEEQEIPTKT